MREMSLRQKLCRFATVGPGKADLEERVRHLITSRNHSGLHFMAESIINHFMDQYIRFHYDGKQDPFNQEDVSYLADRLLAIVRAK